MVELPVSAALLPTGVSSKPRTPTRQAPEERLVVQLLVEMTEALHRAGAPAHRLEATVTAVGRALAVQTAVFATPTSVFLEVSGHTRLLRVEPQEVALADVVAVDRVARDLIEGRCSLGQARGRLCAIRQARPPWGRLAQRVAWAGVGGSAAVFFGGSGPEVVLAALLSGVVGALPGRLGNLLPLVASAVVYTVARAAAPLLGTDLDVVLLAGLVVLLPGFSVTVGLTELATRNLAAGSARLSGAGVTLLQLGVGVELGRALTARLLPGVALPATGLPLGPGSEGLAILAAAVSFLVLFRARWPDLPAIAAVALLAVQGTRLGAAALGADGAPFVGALAVGLAANLHARIRDVPALTLLVPGIILLVPGSLGFRGVSALVEGQGSLLDAARMFLVGASLVAGVLTANALLPPRRAL